MSYRAFKRLFGETSLERKCRIWLGTGILSMMTLSFIVFARRTENLAYVQTRLRVGGACGAAISPGFLATVKP